MNFNELFNKIKAIDEGRQWQDERTDGHFDEPDQNDESLEEGKMAELDQLLRDIVAGDVDAYDVMNYPKTPVENAAAQQLQSMYDEAAHDHRLNPDDDFERILDIVVDNLAHDLGPADGMDESEEHGDEDERRSRRDDYWDKADRDYEQDREHGRPGRFRDEPTADEISADRADRAERQKKVDDVMSWMFPSKKPKSESMVDECGGMPPMPMPAPEQQDSVSMNVSMNGSGPGGIRDLMDILRNIEKSAESDLGSDEADIVVKKEPGFDFMSIDDETDEGFANSPDEVYHDISASMPAGNDLNRPKKSFKHNPLGGDNKMAESIAVRLAKRYDEIVNKK